MNGVANLSLAARSDVGDIHFIDLKAQQRRIRKRIENRLGNVLDHGRYIAGPEIDELEAVLAERTGAAGAVACASGTAALIIPLLSWGLGPQDAVFLPAYTYNATANAVLLAGAHPVFVDIDPQTFNICPDDLGEKIAQVRSEGRFDPKGVVAVDLFGAPADYDRILPLAAREGMRVLADGAQSFGGRLHDKWVGAVASTTALSFFPGKALGAYGDSGAVTTTDPETLEAWRSIRWHGTDEARKTSVRVGFNGRMDSFQAAVLLEKIAIIDEELEARRRVAAAYDARLDGLVGLQRCVDGAMSGLNYYAIRTGNRDAVAARLKHLGVPTAIYYQTALHEMPAFASYARQGGLEETERLCREVLALPMHPYLTPDQVAYVGACVAETVCELS